MGQLSLCVRYRLTVTQTDEGSLIRLFNGVSISKLICVDDIRTREGEAEAYNKKGSHIETGR